jgi:hypothetical protein
MENPYAASIAPPEPSKEGGKPRPFWRGLLLAYVVHHFLGALGHLAGWLLVWRDSPNLFALEDAWWMTPLFLLYTPILDFFLLIEPLGAGEMSPATFMAFKWLRSVFVLTIPVAVVAHAITRHRGLLWYLGIISFLLCMSVPLLFVMDGRIASQSAGCPPGPGLVPAVGLQDQQSQLQSFAAEALVEFPLLVFTPALDDDLEQLGRPTLAGRLGRRSGWLAIVGRHGGCHCWLCPAVPWASGRRLTESER